MHLELNTAICVEVLVQKFRLSLLTLLKAGQDCLNIKQKEEFLPFCISSLHFMLPGKELIFTVCILWALSIISAN